jgi:hypothetical protein
MADDLNRFLEAQDMIMSAHWRKSEMGESGAIGCVTISRSSMVSDSADGKVASMPLSGASEEFSCYAPEAPGLYVMLRITPAGQDPA